jgi:hypothetical protein
MNINTKTKALFIVQRGEIVSECSAPWCPDLRNEFDREFQWYRRQEWLTVKVEASDEEEAIAMYHQKADLSDQYYNSL